MNKDPLKRATVDELLNDPFVNGIGVNDLPLQPMIYIRPFYNRTTTMLKFAVSEVLASNMTEEPEKQIIQSINSIGQT